MATRDAAKSALRVLVVDDHEDLRDLFVEVLAAHGHDAVGVDDGEAALAELFARPYHAAIVDLYLPKMDGVAVAREANAKLGHAAPLFVALSGAHPGDMPATDRALFLRVLTKPTVPDVVLALLEGEVARRATNAP